MLRIKHKELASILGVKVESCRQLLYRKHLSLTNKYLDDIIDLIVKRRVTAKEKEHAKVEDRVD